MHMVPINIRVIKMTSLEGPVKIAFWRIWLPPRRIVHSRFSIRSPMPRSIKIMSKNSTSWEMSSSERTSSSCCFVLCMFGKVIYFFIFREKGKLMSSAAAYLGQQFASHESHHMGYQSYARHEKHLDPFDHAHHDRNPGHVGNEHC